VTVAARVTLAIAVTIAVEETVAVGITVVVTAKKATEAYVYTLTPVLHDKRLVSPVMFVHIDHSLG
jgi:hypothetical protein